MMDIHERRTELKIDHVIKTILVSWLLRKNGGNPKPYSIVTCLSAVLMVFFECISMFLILSGFSEFELINPTANGRWSILWQAVSVGGLMRRDSLSRSELVSRLFSPRVTYWTYTWRNHQIPLLFSGVSRCPVSSSDCSRSSYTINTNTYFLFCLKENLLGCSLKSIHVK